MTDSAPSARPLLSRFLVRMPAALWPDLRGACAYIGSAYAPHFSSSEADSDLTRAHLYNNADSPFAVAEFASVRGPQINLLTDSIRRLSPRLREQAAIVGRIDSRDAGGTYAFAVDSNGDCGLTPIDPESGNLVLAVNPLTHRPLTDSVISANKFAEVYQRVHERLGLPGLSRSHNTPITFVTLTAV